MKNLTIIAMLGLFLTVPVNAQNDLAKIGIEKHKIGDTFLAPDGVNTETYLGNGLYSVTLVYVGSKDEDVIPVKDTPKIDNSTTLEQGEVITGVAGPSTLCLMVPETLQNSYMFPDDTIFKLKNKVDILEDRVNELTRFMVKTEDKEYEQYLNNYRNSDIVYKTIADIQVGSYAYTCDASLWKDSKGVLWINTDWKASLLDGGVYTVLVLNTGSGYHVILPKNTQIEVGDGFQNSSTKLVTRVLYY